MKTYSDDVVAVDAHKTLNDKVDILLLSVVQNAAAIKNLKYLAWAAGSCSVIALLVAVFK
jgi:hypothetical protein